MAREPKKVNLEKWVKDADNDPVVSLQRQATEILLSAIADTKDLRDTLFLKGGVLMGVYYESPRQTSDVDFSTNQKPDDDYPEELITILNIALERVPRILNYPDIVCRIQSYKLCPKTSLSQKSFPAIKAKMGFARRGTRDFERLQLKNCTSVISIDISFNEPIDALEIVVIEGVDSGLMAYSIYDILAEKFRAVLQQPIRNRNRRQDIYDIDYLLKYFEDKETEKERLIDVLNLKCKSRNIDPVEDGLADPEVRERSERDWNTLRDELDELPDFDQTYDRVMKFYESLPWNKLKPAG